MNIDLTDYSEISHTSVEMMAKQEASDITLLEKYQDIIPDNRLPFQDRVKLCRVLDSIDRNAVYDKAELSKEFFECFNRYTPHACDIKLVEIRHERVIEEWANDWKFQDIIPDDRRVYVEMEDAKIKMVSIDYKDKERQGPHTAIQTVFHPATTKPFDELITLSLITVMATHIKYLD